MESPKYNVASICKAENGIKEAIQQLELVHSQIFWMFPQGETNESGNEVLMRDKKRIELIIKQLRNLEFMTL